MSSSAANQGDNTVSVAQGGTTTPGATKQLLSPDRVLILNVYILLIHLVHNIFKRTCAHFLHTDRFKYFYVTLIILLTINHLFVRISMEIHVIFKWIVYS